MSLHEAISHFQSQFIDERRDCAVLSAAAIASATYEAFCEGDVEAHIQYASLEHFKHMARKAMARHFDDEGDQNAAYEGQGELFSGHLQERYPIPRKQGEEPQYKLRSLLTPEERAWNVKKIRKSGEARLAHADALEAEGMTKAAA